MRSESGTGSGVSKTEFTIVKIAVLAPIHTANVSIAVAAYPRSFHNTFNPKRMSRITHASREVELSYGIRVTRVPEFLGTGPAFNDGNLQNYKALLESARFQLGSNFLDMVLTISMPFEPGTCRPPE